MGKFGEGVGAAYLRQGIAELRAAVSFHSPIEQPTDYGMWGVATPGEAAQARMLMAKPSMLTSTQRRKRARFGCSVERRTGPR